MGPRFSTGNLSPASQPSQFDAVWRKLDWNNKDALLKEVKEYDREDENIKHIRILLHGPIGAGKSSFVKSAMSVLKGRMTHGAAVDALGGTSYTLEYKTHTIKKGKGQNYPFVFNDIMGLEGEQGIKEEDIELAMKGHVKEGYTFHPSKPMTDKDPDYIKDPKPEDKIHVLVCVIPADQVAILSKTVVDKIRKIRLAARDLDIPQICIITKIDQADPLMEKDVKNVYKMKIVKEKMQEFSDRAGFPMTDIFPVKNYHEETDLDNDIDVLILKALQHMINMGEDFIEKM